MCQETPLSNFSPAWRPPHAKSSACTAAQIDGFYDHCLAATASTLTCAYFVSRTESDANCSACILSKSTDPEWGPLVDFGDYRIELNSGGCLALADGDLTENGCGAKLSARDRCTFEACVRNCPLLLDPQGLWLSACRERTRTPNNQCYSFEVASYCAANFIGQPGGLCLWGNGDSYRAVYTRIANAFCL
jgi:hypothetical protein